MNRIDYSTKFTGTRETGSVATVALFKKGFALLREWWERNESRREMATMGERDCRDIGATYREIVAESNKPFWQPIKLRRVSQEAELSSPDNQQVDENEASPARRWIFYLVHFNNRQAR